MSAIELASYRGPYLDRQEELELEVLLVRFKRIYLAPPTPEEWRLKAQ